MFFVYFLSKSVNPTSCFDIARARVAMVAMVPLIFCQVPLTAVWADIVICLIQTGDAGFALSGVAARVAFTRGVITVYAFC